jgi:hypothetical protein
MENTGMIQVFDFFLAIPNGKPAAAFPGIAHARC